MANKPFRVNRSALPTEDARKMFNPVNCFAKGELTMGADEKPRLAGDCQVVQFGKNRNGNNCMFVCQADFSEVQREHPVLASFVFDHMGRVIDLYYGNSVATPTWRTNVCDGTRASFGFLPPPPPPQQPQIMPMFSYRMNKINDQLKQNAKNMSKDEIDALLRKRNKLKEEYEAEAAEAAKKAKTARDAYDELLKNPRWGCARVLKGPLDFIGCQREDRWSSSVSLVEGVQYVSCVEVSADFDNQFDTSPENLPKIKPYFEHIPLTGTSRYGASGRYYYNPGGLSPENQFGNTGFQSFVVMDSNGTSMIETRQGSCSRPEPIPPRLSVSKPETRQKFEVELRKRHASVRTEMAALKWLEMNPLVFPEGPIDETFADVSFRWVHDFSMKFKAPAVSLSSDALAKMMERTLQQQRVLPGSTQTFRPAMVAPAMRQSIFSAIATGSPPYRQPVTSCKCTPTNHNPTCKNRFCKYRYASVQCFSFEWPIRRIVSEPPDFVRLLAEQIFESQDGERKKKLAAEVAETKRKAAADKKAAEATLRKAEAAAAKASGVPPAQPASLRSRRAPSASAAPVVASSAVASSASAEPASRKRKPASAASQSESSKKTKGGSKSKSKRRVRK